MKYIITEGQYNNLNVRRRAYAIDGLVELRLNEVNKGGKFYLGYCEYGSDTFIKVICEWVVEQMYWDYFSDDMDDDSDEWSNIVDIINDYIIKVHHDKIIELYNNLCNID